MEQAWDTPFDEIGPLFKTAAEGRKENLLNLRFFIHASGEDLKQALEPKPVDRGLDGWAHLAETLAATGVTRADPLKAYKMRRHLHILELLQGVDRGN